MCQYARVHTYHMHVHRKVVCMCVCVCKTYSLMPKNDLDGRMDHRLFNNPVSTAIVIYEKWVRMDGHIR
jgi:hypothetical protein